jgi:membrane associated rhomboid family serine protease
MTRDNNPFEVKFTRRRLWAAVALFIVATILLWMAGVDMSSYLMGAVAGLAVIGAIAGWLFRKQQRSKS